MAHERLQHLYKAKDVDGDTNRDNSQMPDWMDIKRFQRGQEFFKRNWASVGLGQGLSLITHDFTYQHILDVFRFSQCMNTVDKAANQFSRTVAHITQWHLENPWDVSTKAYKSVQHVRKLHHRIRRDMKKKDHEAGSKPGVHITAFDMAMVQLGCTLYVVLHGPETGLTASEEEISDYVFFWRGVGYLLGMPEEYNVCAGDYEDVKDFFKEIEKNVVAKNLENPPEGFHDITDMVVKSSLPQWSTEGVLGFCRKLHGIPAKFMVTESSDISEIKSHTNLLHCVPGYASGANNKCRQAFEDFWPVVDKDLDANVADTWGVTEIQ